jgi:hypothetical protein
LNAQDNPASKQVKKISEHDIFNAQRCSPSPLFHSDHLRFEYFGASAWRPSEKRAGAGNGQDLAIGSP